MKQRMVMDNFPIQGGLVNAGGQTVIPETAFWEMENASTGLDGRVYKRPGLKQWGHTLKEPDTGGVGWHEFFGDLSHFLVTSPDTGTSFVDIDAGFVRLFESAVTANGSFIVRNPQPQDGTIGAGESGKCCVRLLFKANALSANLDSASFYGAGIGIRTDTANEFKALILDDGLYYYNGVVFTPITGTEGLADFRWHVLEIQLSGLTATIYIDDDETAVATVTWVNYTADALNLSTHSAGLRAGLGSGQEAAGNTIDWQVDFLQYRSGIPSTGHSLINGVPVTALFDWASHDPNQKHLLAVAGDLIYNDEGHAGRFRVLDSTPSGDLTTFAPWLSELLIINPQREVRRWTGTGVPTDEARVLPKHVYAATSHQSRVCVVSEDSPLVVHVSAANDISDWTTEDSVSASGESFFLSIPDAKGRRVVGMQGDFFGQLIIWTEESAFTLQGSSIDTFVLQRISQATGMVGPNAFDMAAKDMIFASSRGVHTIATVVQYGDMAASDMSAGLRNLWQRDNQFGLRKIINDKRSTVTHAPELARTYLAVRQQGDSRPASIYEYNHDAQRWSGPWGIECEAARFVLLGVPGTPVLLVGDTAGRVSLVNSDRRSDRGDTSFDFRVRSARIDGRSLDPSLRRRDKHWGELRLFVLPRGAEGIELSYTADGHKRSETVTVSQNKYNEGLLDTTFFLDQSSIVAAEKMAVVTHIIDKRSKWLEFEVSSTSLDGDLVIMGWQIDFQAAQDSKENA